MFYRRMNEKVFFLFPTVAIGVDAGEDYYCYFMEFAWFNFVFGIGQTPF